MEELFSNKYFKTLHSAFERFFLLKAEHDILKLLVETMVREVKKQTVKVGIVSDLKGR